MFRSPTLAVAALLLAILAGWPGAYTLARGINQTPDAFLAETFDNKPPKPGVVWLTGDLKKEVADILQHPYAKLRVKYWREGKRSVWILDEIGKEKPITVGIVIDDGKISELKVLAFRESRGWEVELPFFTRQFRQATLSGDNRLDKEIDGITGATLSVRALKKLARMALLLDRKTGAGGQ